MSFLNFEPDILERIDSLSRSQDQRRKLFEEIASTLADRQKLEEFYARSLERLCEGLSKIKISAASEYPKQLVSTLISLFSIEAEQSTTFASSISSEVIPLLKDACKDEPQQLKNTSKIGERHESDLIRNLNAFEAMRKQYFNHSQALATKLKQTPPHIALTNPTFISSHHDSTNSAIATHTTNPHQNNHHVHQTMNNNSMTRVQQNDQIKEQAALNYLQRQKLDSEKEFEKQIVKYNKYIDEYFTDVARIEDQIVQQECAKRDLLQDSMMKILVFKVSFVRSLQYDVDRVTTRLTNLDTKASIKQYLNETLLASADRSRANKNLPPKPLLTKLHFDNYKQHVDSTFKASIAEQQSLRSPQLNSVPAPTQSNTTTEQFNQLNTNHLNLPVTTTMNDGLKQKPRSKIFSTNQASGTSQNQQQQSQQHMNLAGLVSFERRPQQQPQQNSSIDAHRQQPSQQRDNGIETQKQQQAQSCVVPPTSKSSNETSIVTKKPSIKQPIKCTVIDIMKLIEAKNKRLNKESEVVEIEREDFFEYLLLKVWHNNEVMGYDIEQLRVILQTSEGRHAFSEYFCRFFEGRIQSSRAEMIAAESNAAERILLEKMLAAMIEVEINSDAYTQLMRIVYCLLDVSTSVSSSDVHGISRVFTIAKSMFKVIRPPDENIVCFQRIYLHEGLSGHALFANDAHWQSKLSAILDEIEEAYSNRVKLLASADSSTANDELSSNSSRNRVLSESEFIVKKLQGTVRDFVGFSIPKPRIAQLFANLTMSSEVATQIQQYISEYAISQTTFLQTEEISSINANSNDRIFQKRLSGIQEEFSSSTVALSGGAATAANEQEYQNQSQQSFYNQRKPSTDQQQPLEAIRDFEPNQKDGGISREGTQNSSEEQQANLVRREVVEEEEEGAQAERVDGVNDCSGEGSDQEDYPGNDPEVLGEKKDYFLDGLS